MEKIVLIGHGSPKKDANNVEIMADLLHSALHPGCSDRCVKAAYMQFAKPDIADALDACTAEGAERVVVHPFFLCSGMHVTKDIPAAIDEAKKKHPGVEFIYTEPLGVHENLVRVVLERIGAARFTGPGDIERRSFEIISEEGDFTDVPEERLPIVKRVIHATADFELARTLVFHDDAVGAGIAAIRAGKDILTDVEMVRTGINKRSLSRWGGKVLCGIRPDQDDRPGRHDQPDRGAGAHTEGRTRAAAGIEEAFGEGNNIGIIAIGNAPTALLKTIDILAGAKPPFPLVVGVPVGFVKALESKALLSAQPFPFITNLSRKGGTPVAVAIVNALLKMAAEEE